MPPNLFYQQSLVLFWSIVGIGSRSLTADPTLLRSLGPLVMDLALASSRTREDPLPVIKGLLLLCTWPFPTYSTFRDNTFALCGLLMNLALQAGIHLPSATHEFTKTPGYRPISKKMTEIAAIWLHVVLTCQR
jgi:transcriptional regulatory protein LEU3